jgi:Xaa-Pro aminopeptidase
MKKQPLRKTFIPIILLIIWAGSLNAQDLSREHFAKRRNKLMEQLGNDCIAIFKTPLAPKRNSDIDHPFRQSSDFYYLTGFEEHGSVLLLVPGEEKSFIMFVRPASTMASAWTGELCGINGAMTTFGADTAHSIGEVRTILPIYLEGKDKIYFNSTDLEFRKKISKMVKDTRKSGPRRRLRAVPHIHDMRLIKSPEEIKLLRKAIDITCDAHIEAMRSAEPGMYEYEIQAIIEYIFRKNGSPRNGFPSIIGSGSNSTVLHYEASISQTSDGDVICMDIGAEYGYYTADITRTIPVNGKFTPEQRDIYEIVFKAEREAVQMTAPGKGVQELYTHAYKVLREGLYRLGLVTDPESRWQSRIWTPHGIGHWLGLDVHDVWGLGYVGETGVVLKPGMVFTVEPGIYITERALESISGMVGNLATEEEIEEFILKVKPVVQKYNNIGIRIEDDVLVTKDGYENLSAKAPREIHEIEKLMAERSYFNQ